MRSPLVIQYAMRGEAAPLLAAGRFTSIVPPLSEPYGFEFFEGQTRLEDPVIVAVAGLDRKHQVDAIGTLRAGLLTHEIAQKFRPSRIINAGTAGGFLARGGRIGDVYLGQSPAVFHDRRVPLPGNFPKFAEGHRVLEDDPQIAESLGLKRGIVSTGDSLDCTPEDLKNLMRLEASAKEMEAAAIATVCEAHKIPLTLLKSITDIVDHPPEAEAASTPEQFLQNYSVAVTQLTLKLELLVRHFFKQIPNQSP